MKEQIDRRAYIGSSGMPAILGVSPYQTAWDLWAWYVGLLPDKEDNKAMMAGRLFERGLLEYAKQELGAMTRNVRAVGPPPLAAQCDAVLKASGEPVEAKYTMAESDQYGEEHTDQVPLHVLVQLHVQMICLNTPTQGFVSAYRAYKGFGIYEVQRNDDLCDIILKKANEFWGHVMDKTPPTGAPSIEIAKKVIRQPNKVALLPAPKVQQWLEAKAAVKSAEEHEEALRASIMSDLVDAEAGLTPGLGQLTYYEQTRTELDLKSLQDEYPTVYDMFKREKTYRVLRWKGTKNGER